jgi:hypothetical protein
MKIVAFLQNLWVKDVAHFQKFFERYPDQRERMLKKLLFYNCKTGRVLKAGLGEELCEKIVWEESTTEIAGDAKKVFPPDLAHIESVLKKHRPEVVIAIGKVAAQATFMVINRLVSRQSLMAWKIEFLSAPHPCARPPLDPLARFKEIRAKIESGVSDRSDISIAAVAK